MVTKAQKLYSGLSLKERREAALYTQVEFAFQIGVTQETVSRWENRERYPSLKNCRKMREFFTSVERAFGISMNLPLQEQNQ